MDSLSKLFFFYIFEGDDPQPAPDHPALVSSAPVILEERNELSASVTAEPRGQVVQDMEEAVAEQEEEECPPLVCWHCNVTLPSLEDLQDHVQIHQGELLKKTKEYRCSECKKVSRFSAVSKSTRVYHKNQFAT